LTVEAISEALVRSNPNSLKHLQLENLRGSFDPLSQALLSCPSLTSLNITERTEDDRPRNLLPVVQVLHRLPLVDLALHLNRLTDESIECLLSFLSHSAVQDLALGTITPTQLQLFADALPSLPSLQSLDFETFDFHRLEHESSFLSFFSALPKSSLRSLTLYWTYFRNATLKTCLNKIPESQLTSLRFLGVVYIYADGFDPAIHDRNSKMLDEKVFLEWNVRFPKIKDRFCLITTLMSQFTC
jgi:hypothetical protein